MAEEQNVDQTNDEEGLSLDDLINVLRIINTATDRGAFKAHELSLVGGVYDRFARFIKQAQDEKASAEQSEDGASDTNDSE